MKQDLSTLTALNPLDGRYRNKTAKLSPYLSEYALIKYRLEIEIRYLIALSENKILRKLTTKEKNLLYSLFLKFSVNDAFEIKKIEEETRHDAKAIEEYLRLKLLKTSLKDTVEMLHFGLTSEDISNIAYRLMIRDALDKVIYPTLKSLAQELFQMSKKYKSVVILGRTHGQSAVPTTFGKELAVFAQRVNKQIIELKKQTLTGKLNGAVGNFNALYFTYPDLDWLKFSKKFVSSFNLYPNLLTTQINPFEDIISIFQNLHRINGVILDFDTDIWRYISDGWIKLSVKTKEVGSSTMPQKVNPIDFENSEGNLTLANGLFETINQKLYVSRLQRDLSNSTVIRNSGTVLGYSLLGYESALTGISRIDLNMERINEELEKDWSILSEALQTYLRKEGFKDSYNFISYQTKGKSFSKNSWQNLILNLPIDKKHKDYLLRLTPKSYTGLAETLVGQLKA